MTDAIELALISDDNDQVNSVAVWDVRTGACLLQYKGENLLNFSFVYILF